MKKTFHSRGRLVRLDRPLVMGILNRTPDSFFRQGLDSDAAALNAVEQMVEQGAQIVDIGGMTTKPGSAPVPLEEEWRRVAACLRAVKERFPDTLVSLDTYRSEMVRRAFELGVDMINDISAGDLDSEMLPTVGRLGLPYIAMHMQGTPTTMQLEPQYDNVVQDLLGYFREKMATFEAQGIRDTFIDPGFGFGKTLEQNYELLQGLHQFAILERPILVGLSRKSMVYRLLGNTPAEALNGSSILQFVALQQGAQILRVHDVQEAREAIVLWEMLRESTT